MRTTVRIDDDLLVELKRRASREGRTLSEVVNSALRDSLGGRRETVRSFRQRTCDLGQPSFDVTRANAVASALDDAETICKLVGSS
jgi:Arc/MetJ family transcription regulator